MIQWTLAAVVGLALISAVMTLMLFRFVAPGYYLRCRPPLFIGGVVFMPLFVAIAVALRTEWSAADRAGALVALMAGFWASAAWLASRRTQGVWVPGLRFGPGLEFRPDLILPGGVTFVKGLILTGIGIMLAVQDGFRLPRWNWWGFVMAFFGIITLIPIRGVVKMLARRARFLGRPAPWQIPARWGLVVVGLTVLLYGFLAAFMGRTPIVEFRPVAAKAGWSGALVVVAVGSLLLREFWKKGLQEGIETMARRLASNLWLYASVLVFMYGTILAFMGRFMTPHPDTNPAGLIMGAGLFALGAILVLVARPVALRNELDGMIRIMVGSLAALDRDARHEMMSRRMRTIAGYPARQRAWHVAAMLAALGTLPPEASATVEETRLEVMTSLSAEERRSMMEAMDALVG